jgi:aminopeptidase
MPLDDDFLPQINNCNADLQNVSTINTQPLSVQLTAHLFFQTGRPAGSAAAAMFLKAFAEGCEPEDDQPATLRWAHIDMASVMEATCPSPYQEKGMTGRPVR